MTRPHKPQAASNSTPAEPAKAETFDGKPISDQSFAPEGGFQKPAGDGPGEPQGVVGGDAGKPAEDKTVVADKAPEAPAAAPAPPVPTADEMQRLARFEAILAEAELQRAADAVRVAERDAQIADLLAALGRKADSGPSKVTIIGGFNQDVAAQAWAMVHPDRVASAAPNFARSYKIIPTGDSAKKSMPIADVHNVADESDAKTWYLLKLNIPAGVTLTCNVERLPDSAGA